MYSFNIAYAKLPFSYKLKQFTHNVLEAIPIVTKGFIQHVCTCVYIVILRELSRLYIFARSQARRTPCPACQLVLTNVVEPYRMVLES